MRMRKSTSALASVQVREVRPGVLPCAARRHGKEKQRQRVCERVSHTGRALDARRAG